MSRCRKKNSRFANEKSSAPSDNVGFCVRSNRSWAWAADKSETRWSSIEEFSTSRRRGDPGFSESKEIYVTRVGEIRNSCEFERIEERADVESAYIECVSAGARVELDVSTEKEKDGKRARIDLVTVRTR